MSFIRGGGWRVQYIMGNGHMGPLPHCGQTDAYENITFLQLCLQAVRVGNIKMNIESGRMDFSFLASLYQTLTFQLRFLHQRRQTSKVNCCRCCIYSIRHIILSVMFSILRSGGFRISQCLHLGSANVGTEKNLTERHLCSL